ncbi:MAG TPA: dialkylresorcinol condensing enzyme DarA [Ohtaekwangia sp.]|uniref:dialkylrecorsinol condensing enzyme DarA n=1 Tax=Ohtaekwangia sp. TaxID=2066019 RepID=UPI002F92E7D1
MKKILIVYYTQSGQQLSILQSLSKPLVEAGHTVHFEEIQPQEKYPFPWSAYQFFNAFPETFSQKPLALKSLSAQAFDQYDLVILGYQPWFLTPSRPISSFLQSDDGKKILNGKPVVTILGCRNMWLGAQEKVKQRLLDAQATLVGHIALADRSGNLTSLITILRWMFTGNRKPFWFFPQAGVSNNDVQHAEAFGKLIANHLASNDYTSLQTEFLQEGAIDIRPNLVLMERRGQKAFSVWSKFIASGGAMHSTGRKIRVYIFMYLLPTAIFFLSPLLWTLSKTMLIVKRKELILDVEYFKQNSLRKK